MVRRTHVGARAGGWVVWVVQETWRSLSGKATVPTYGQYPSLYVALPQCVCGAIVKLLFSCPWRLSHGRWQLVMSIHRCCYRRRYVPWHTNLLITLSLKSHKAVEHLHLFVDSILTTTWHPNFDVLLICDIPAFELIKYELWLVSVGFVIMRNRPS